MSRPCKLSNNAKEYLRVYHSILDEMIQKMCDAELTKSISHNFIVQMIPHHQAAIEMSQNILLYTTNVPLQKIATNIISEQTKGIENMDHILSCCEQLENSPRDLCLYQRKIDQIMLNMFSKMEDADTTNQINCDFMWEMIPHHRGAIEMASNTLQYDICTELIPILQSIIASQKKGILEMQTLLKCMGC